MSTPETPTPELVRVERWRSTPGRRWAMRWLEPVFWLLNRPSMQWFAHASYDFALRCNGIAINFPGKRGLTRPEERLIARLGPGLANGVVLDVGANEGTYARELARVAPTARIFAFEPHPRTFARLKVRLSGSPVEPVQCALGDKPGEMMLFDFASADGSTQASLSAASVHLYTAEAVSHRVRVSTIDEFMSERGLPAIDFLKIDTEGFDINVLRGAQAAITQRKIRMIQFEFIGANVANRVMMRDFFEVLVGYRLGRLCMNGQVLPLDEYSIKRCEIFVNQNIIASLP